MTISWPHGRRCAVTFFDDTDWATVPRVKPVYDLLADLGIFTTKSVWIFEGEADREVMGHSCQVREYLDWVLALQRRGFEIALHNVAPVSSPRARISAGLERFREYFGTGIFPHCNHYGCDESLYWGDARLSGWRRAVYNVATRGRRRGRFRGHMEGSPLFWGDLCRERVSYIRNFVFEELNTLAVCPEMPYHDPARQWANFWFASADGASLRRFLKNFTPERIDRLEQEGGACIGYVHFGAGFTRYGKLDPEFRSRMEYLARKDAWFAPVTPVLDHLRAGQNREQRIISRRRLAGLETRWLSLKLRRGTS